MKKVVITVPQANVPQKPQANVPQEPKKLELSDIVLPRLNAEDGDVDHSTFGYLLDALTNPNLDNIDTEMALAYSRIKALTIALTVTR